MKKTKHTLRCLGMTPVLRSPALRKALTTKTKGFNMVAKTESPDVHEWTGPTGVHFRDIKQRSGTYYREGMPSAVINGLESARINRYRVRVFYGDAKTGHDWKKQFDVVGTVSRSTGHIPIPILLASPRSTSGAAILCDGIVRLIVNSHEVYRHPKYKMPAFTLKAGSLKGYPAEVYDRKGVCARFSSEAKAKRWIAFMRGERLGK